MDIILESERDKRTLNWLIDQVGLSAVEQACAQLAGERKPYVSNVAKTLKLQPPESVLYTPKEEAQEHLSALKKTLRTKQM